MDTVALFGLSDDPGDERSEIAKPGDAVETSNTRTVESPAPDPLTPPADERIGPLGGVIDSHTEGSGHITTDRNAAQPAPDGQTSGAYNSGGC